MKRGSLNVGRRLEQVMGNFSANYFNFNIGSKGTKVKPSDFMPYEEHKTETLESYMARMVGK